MSATMASRNGHSANPVGDGRLSREDAGGEAREGLPARLVRALAGQVSRRVPPADLDERDPDYIREALPGLWLLSSRWFRGEVCGLGNIPEGGPVLLVGNHSGGNLLPDTTVFTLAFSAYFGVERRFYQLAHNLVLSMPGLGFLRKFGTVAASPENAEKVLRSGAAVLVYPGGDHGVHRPASGLRGGGSGILGWAAEHVAAPTVRGHLRRSLQQLKRQVEHEQLRRHAAARRSSRDVSDGAGATSSGGT